MPLVENKWARANVGDRFGELTIESLIKKTDLGNVWLCRCDCGKTATRTTAALRSRVVAGGSPCCRECLRELRAGQWIEHRERRAEVFRRRWETYRTLWSPIELERIEQDIREEVGRELGGWSKTTTSWVDEAQPLPLPIDDEDDLLLGQFSGDFDYECAA